MDLAATLPILLGLAWLIPLASFTAIVLAGPRMGKHGEYAAYVATGAILTSFVLSVFALFGWVGKHGFGGGHDADHGTHAASGQLPPHSLASSLTGNNSPKIILASALAANEPASGHSPSDHGTSGHADKTHDGDDHHDQAAPVAYLGEWYRLAIIGGSLQLNIGYYIDALTVIMFTMVTLIASCIHFYAMGYMHDELHDVTDHEVTLKGNPYGHDDHSHHEQGHHEQGHGHADHGHTGHGDTGHGDTGHGHDAHSHDNHGHDSHGHGNHLVRPGRFHRFFQYLSLFCFSMLGLVYAGNIAMVFVFWELVGICSYFLIGFYFERNSASTAANKAFIVNRIGDFGMLIGLMALWGALGTFNFGDTLDSTGHITQAGIFSQVRPADQHHQLTVPANMVLYAARDQANARVRDAATPEAAQATLDAAVTEWRGAGMGYWLLTIAGLGIFCGCVGKSAQFPLHVWLPDAMEGPTPVSALVHSATMVAAGVYLVGRFFPVFTPEALLVIAYTGAITLFIAATIAITANDIKRVLAYSTVSQLGYMMLALGVGGWLAGLFHLITHAFFKSLLFMCSGSVIHACHTNDMQRMGGLRHKMPWTAYTMLVGCLAIAGAGIPLAHIGLSGYYSKDAILEQAYLFSQKNPAHGILFVAPALGAAITAFYMFRMWFLTFAGKPRDQHIHDHAHESPPIMYVPLVILSVFAIGVGWGIGGVSLVDLLEQARPLGTLAGATGAAWNVVVPNEHDSHAGGIPIVAGLTAFGTAGLGFVLAVVFYGLRYANPAEVQRAFSPLYTFLWNKWYFDELYNAIFVQPVMFISRRFADFDKYVIDRIIDGAAYATRAVARVDDLLDRFGVDGVANGIAHYVRTTGYSLSQVQTGKLRQYVMFIAVGTVAVFALVAFLVTWSMAGQ
ncbi:MAG: NADH-quinone oxidoreductase subunit L [Pirellulales bacterium]|nr:NADH-quinone oxidoreductase subunit L [Pirellulales bacterium]